MDNRDRQGGAVDGEEPGFGERTTRRGGADELRGLQDAAEAAERERASRERAALEVAVARGEVSAGSLPTQDHPVWRTQEEWQGKRWQKGEAILGRYVVEGELGKGGWGSCARAGTRWAG